MYYIEKDVLYIASNCDEKKQKLKLKQKSNPIQSNLLRDTLSLLLPKQIHPSVRLDLDIVRACVTSRGFRDRVSWTRGAWQVAAPYFSHRLRPHNALPSLEIGTFSFLASVSVLMA
ncbi:hypothetical protein CEXT_87751 [Caerostris extrusa]|uniref:Uncharacterized protein n=1 Tax=Caerostris extrusa TaxID=172846 RepID=A0AAV4Y4V6_CAEEX|nr:hypothetical protein CEXT_87751 [Caerostris extrusa]